MIGCRHFAAQFRQLRNELADRRRKGNVLDGLADHIGQASLQFQSVEEGVLLVGDKFDALAADTVHILHIAEERGGTSHQRRRLRQQRVGDVLAEQRNAIAPAIGSVFRRQLIAAGALGFQVGIGHRQCRTGGDRLIKLGHGRHAVGHAERGRQGPGIRRLVGQRGLGREGGGGQFRLADIQGRRGREIHAAIGAPTLKPPAQGRFPLVGKGPDVLHPCRIGGGAALGQGRG